MSTKEITIAVDRDEDVMSERLKSIEGILTHLELDGQTLRDVLGLIFDELRDLRVDVDARKFETQLGGL